jgi:GT2 family glycosyltransferase
MVDVSIIIVNYNTTELTHQCIQSIQKWTSVQSYEIIVVDNASPDQSISRLVDSFSEVRLILNKENIGFGRANNLGIKQAVGKYIFLINSDTYLLHDAIEVFFSYMEEKNHQQVACCGGDLFSPEGKTQMSYGNFPSVLEAISNLGFYLLYKEYYEKHIRAGVYNYSQDNKVVDYITGADMFLRKSVLDEIGLFDPDFFMYFEETELSYRIKKAGYICVLLPGVQIVHLEGASQDKEAYFNYKKIAMLAKSRNLFFQKCKGRSVAWLVKALNIFRSLIMLCLKRKIGYWKTAVLVFKS